MKKVLIIFAITLIASFTGFTQTAETECPDPSNPSRIGPNGFLYSRLGGNASLRDTIVTDYINMTPWDSERYIPYLFRTGAYGETMDFRMIHPNDWTAESTQKWPLIVMFHGRGERGKKEYYSTPGDRCDMTSQTLINNWINDNKRWRNNDHSMVWSGREHRDWVTSGQYPGFVLFAQEGFGYWVNGPGFTNGYLDFDNVENDPTKEMRMTIELIDYLISLGQVDPDRIYVHGLSSGGSGSWYITMKRPDLIAAASPMSAPGDLSQSQKLSHIPVWLTQGGQDGNPIPAVSHNVMASLRQYGGQEKIYEGEQRIYTEYPNRGHNAWIDTYADPYWMEWMFKQDKTNITIFGDTALCPGSSITMGVDGSFLDYEWKRDGQAIAASTNDITTDIPGQYQVRFLRNIGTQQEWSKWSRPVTVYIREDRTETPEITPLSTTALPPSGSNVTLRGPDGMTSYLWSTGATTQQITVSNIGSYTLEVTAPGECVSLPSAPMVVTRGQGANVPTSPENLRGVVSSETEANLFWDDLSDNETVFEVYRSTSSSGPWSLIARVDANIEYYEDITLNPGTTYYYRVRAINNQGYSNNYTNTISLTTANDNTAPTPPNLTLGSVTENSISLTWDTPEDNSQIVNYNLYQDGVLLVQVNRNDYTVSGLDPNTIYRYTVRAIDAAGNISDHSNQVTAVTTPNGVYYEYYEHLNSINTVDVIGPSVPGGNRFSKTGYAPTFTYDPAERLFNISFIYMSYLDVEVAGYYSFFTSSDDGSKLWVKGNLAVNNDGNHGCRERNSYGNDDGDAVQGIWLEKGRHLLDARYYENSGGECFSVSYEARDINGNVFLSKTTIPATRLFRGPGILPDPPATPTGLSATNITNYQVRLNWNDASNNETGFEVYRSTTSGSGYIMLGTVGQNVEQFIDDTAVPGTDYYYVVKSISNSNTSPASNEASITVTVDNNAPSTPLNLTVMSVGATNIGLSWSASSDDFGVSHYEVYANNNLVSTVSRTTGNGSEMQLMGSTPSTATLITGLTPDTDYDFQVRAVDVGGLQSGFSNTASARTGQEGPLPVEFAYVRAELTDNGNTVTVYWGTALEIDNDYFVIEKSTNGKNFSQIGIVEGNGNSNQLINYSFVDEDVRPKNYYRIKQVDFNGDFDYSEIVSVFRNNSPVKFKVYPNPLVQGSLKVQGEGIIHGDEITYTVFDTYGNPVRTGTTTTDMLLSSEGQTLVHKAELASGMYFLQVVYRNNIYKQKVIIQ
ncbi:fibronectin type III domain-containing protein [Marinigracilibium pacificum]|uniref:T9SS type A sorting domain-containing protein n=1 Tax=Marinigracilibium pacificum TaxID=2729599 RepID=A0A848IYC0_9BACT|nr:fibronectin type III domain-containing protein [Marinigracilibium pacificum]NMM47244.1 T9SS type A sorting domain-containing protein [Marinigracilibium pacificum]